MPRGTRNLEAVRASLVVGATYRSKSFYMNTPGPEVLLARVENRTVEDDGVRLLILRTDGVITKKTSCGLTVAAAQVINFVQPAEFEALLAKAQRAALVRSAEAAEAAKKLQPATTLVSAPPNADVEELARRVDAQAIELARLAARVRTMSAYDARFLALEEELRRVQEAFDWFKHRAHQPRLAAPNGADK